MPTRIEGRPPRRRRLLACVIAALALFGGAAQAAGPDDSSAATAAIAERLHRWTAAFNAKELTAICDLFAPDLSYTVDDILNGSRDRLCASIREALARPGLKLRYEEPTIHEILVSGDLAVVRLTWTLTAERNGARDLTTEEGMDVFRRAPDGLWSIARYIAFSTRPNAALSAGAPPP
jgi:ketosteroid isomerase-like protein